MQSQVNRARKATKSTLITKVAKKLSQTRKQSVLRGSFVGTMGVLLINLITLGTTHASTSGEKRMFTLTGYYSPLPNQSFYITGDYESEKRLNGQGIQGADGTPVFPGMIAAPSNYRFGTKVCLPNFGCGAIHDRGGAIVTKGKRKLARHDRLDLWMGHGEEGLLRALALGVQHVEGTIYTSNSPIKLAVNFKAVTPLAKLIELPHKIVFDKNLSLGARHEDVIKLKKYLQTLAFYKGTLDNHFDDGTEKSIKAFQTKYFLIDNAQSPGAGVFGPKTRAKLSDLIYKKETQQKIADKWAEFEFEANLQTGKRSSEVLKLQEILVQQEFMNHAPTGYFGSITKQALIQFQITQGLVKSPQSAGAGNVGPQTRKILNQLLDTQKQSQEEEAKALLAYQQVSRHLNALAGIQRGLDTLAQK